MQKLAVFYICSCIAEFHRIFWEKSHDLGYSVEFRRIDGKAIFRRNVFQGSENHKHAAVFLFESSKYIWQYECEDIWSRSCHLNRKLILYASMRDVVLQTTYAIDISFTVYISWRYMCNHTIIQPRQEATQVCTIIPGRPRFIVPGLYANISSSIDFETNSIFLTFLTLANHITRIVSYDMSRIPAPILRNDLKIIFVKSVKLLIVSVNIKLSSSNPTQNTRIVWICRWF